MLWTELTSPQFPDAIKQSGGLCLLPFGVLERHGPHLPVGTDQIDADSVAKAAAEVEPAIVFPSYYFGKIFTARHYTGTFAITRTLLLPLLEATCNEIARNGFRKILIVNGHGGNREPVGLFLRMFLDVPHDYVVYSSEYYEMDGKAAEQWEQMRDTDFGDHADELETSLMLHVRPDLVHMEDLGDPQEGVATGQTKHLEGIRHPLTWYAEHPTHYAGDARTASAEKGRFLFDAMVEKLARHMRAVKADRVVPGLLRGFYEKCDHSDLVE
jgi:creatinine amidohydrolase